MCGKGMRLCPVSFGLAIGIASGLCMAVTAWVASYWGIGASLVEFYAVYYVGYAATFVGGVIGGLWGLLEGFIFGFVVALIYNCISRCCCRNGDEAGSCCSSSEMKDKAKK